MVSLLGGFIPPTHTVEKGNPVQHLAQLDDGGDGARWAAAVDVEPGCRVDKVSKRVQLADGRVVVLNLCIFWPGSRPCAPGDKVVVDGAERLVEMVDELAWWNGAVMHREVWTQ
ncbi:hypothetical protein SAMN05216188_11848 [Lentzea xinjiangensis]|uniref:Uncharacterized protein n=1 Tax=Lentzea xinjiangensis TaxID=402600 RepID=A0A1H9TEV0_9PSEU|nr:hypothetical protein [Lentzea xinjiangensis]SER95143.1 hypothetical protein SAMN05216188_11848 [Lentzea xinjiangensis]